MSTNQTAQVATGRDAVLAAVEVFSFLDGLQLHWLSAPDIDFLPQWEFFADRFFRSDR
ncbi:hypothetical protein ACQPZ8_21025 [Actinomadura nitritigenes]|uniref:hypothetical protein n=1 Tax=Actinomadura nitritigenes TaxID=134602 RepID=UPI003D8E4F1E